MNIPSLKEVTIRVDHVWLAKFGLDETHDVFEVRLSIVLAIENASFGKRNLVVHYLAVFLNIRSDLPCRMEPGALHSDAIAGRVSQYGERVVSKNAEEWRDVERSE